MLIAELKASAARAQPRAAAGHGARPSSWTSLAFQQEVAAEVLCSPVAEEFPPRLEYVSRLTKVMILLRLRLCVCVYIYLLTKLYIHTYIP